MSLSHSPCRSPGGWRRQRGAVAVLVAFLLVLLLCFAAFAVDAAHLFVVRNELQNASDASALAGAGYFYEGSTPPNFDLAEEKAGAAIGLNKSMQATLSSGVIQGGYWNSTDGFQLLPMTPASDDAPALKVKISRSGGANGGPVPLTFAKFLGVDSMPVSASAVAVVLTPGSVYPGGLFPLAITKCLFDNFWDSVNKEPKKDPVTKAPYIFRIGSSYHYGSCDSGQWTAFLEDRNDTTTIKDLITNGNPESLSIGNSIWLEPGTKNTIFTFVHNCSAAGDKSCEFVTIPVVTSNAMDTHALSPIAAFACLHILDGVGGSGKYVVVQMTEGCVIEGGGGGPYYGATTPPKLVQ